VYTYTHTHTYTYIHTHLRRGHPNTHARDVVFETASLSSSLFRPFYCTRVNRFPNEQSYREKPTRIKTREITLPIIIRQFGGLDFFTYNRARWHFRGRRKNDIDKSAKSDNTNVCVFVAFIVSRKLTPLQSTHWNDSIAWPYNYNNNKPPELQCHYWQIYHAEHDENFKRNTHTYVENVIYRLFWFVWY